MRKKIFALSVIFAALIVSHASSLPSFVNPGIDPGMTIFTIEENLLNKTAFGGLREARYIFKGEGAEYFILARHALGSGNIGNSYAIVGNKGALCNPKNDLTFRNGANQSYILNRTGTTFINTTDKLFHCLFTVRSESGNQTLTLAVNSLLSGHGESNFSWLFNPSTYPLNVSIISLGYFNNATGLFPPQITILNNNSIRVMLFMSGTDLYGKGLCLGAKNFNISKITYRATNGTLDSGYVPIRKFNQNFGCTPSACKTLVSTPNGIPLHSGIDPSHPLGQIINPGATVTISLNTSQPVLCAQGYNRGLLRFHTLPL
ncbi:MAG: hypothetical protein HYX24_02590 [Candidatus Aenigmarchaeota archaeon]|nr:hypothetical protein [Candidatus Aenigmarchaeota archaeon]